MVAIPRNAPNIPGTPSRIPNTPSRVPNYGDVRAPSSVTLRDVKGRFTTGGWGFEWYNIQELMNLPEEFGAELLDGVKDHVEKLAEEIETYAKENAPWNDRTGDARAGLHTLVVDRNDVYEINLGHSVYYGYFLENYNGGVYAIILPTLRKFAPQLADIADSARNSNGFDHPLAGGFE